MLLQKTIPMVVQPKPNSRILELLAAMLGTVVDRDCAWEIHAHHRTTSEMNWCVLSGYMGRRPETSRVFF